MHISDFLGKFGAVFNIQPGGTCDMHKSLQQVQLTLLNVGYVKLGKKWNYDQVNSPFARLYLITQGSAAIFHHQQKFNLKKGMMYLVPPYTFSGYSCGRNMTQFYTHFLEETGNGLSIFNLKKISYEVKSTLQDEQLFKRLMTINKNRGLSNDNPQNYDNRNNLLNFKDLNNRSSASGFLETQGILQILLSRFIENDKEIPAISHYAINRSLVYIHQHLGEMLTVQSLAGHAHLNPDYFSRLFKEYTGLRPIDYIMNRRIERAQLLLTTTNHTVEEIAGIVGMTNLSYFSRIFSRISKKPPATYRKEYWGM